MNNENFRRFSNCCFNKYMRSGLNIFRISLWSEFVIFSQCRKKSSNSWSIFMHILSLLENPTKEFWTCQWAQMSLSENRILSHAWNVTAGEIETFFHFDETIYIIFNFTITYLTMSSKNNTTWKMSKLKVIFKTYKKQSIIFVRFLLQFSSLETRTIIKLSIREEMWNCPV